MWPLRCENFWNMPPGIGIFSFLKLRFLKISWPRLGFELTFHIKVQQKQQSSSNRHTAQHTGFFCSFATTAVSIFFVWGSFTTWVYTAKIYADNIRKYANNLKSCVYICKRKRGVCVLCYTVFFRRPCRKAGDAWDPSWRIFRLLLKKNGEKRPPFL